MHLYIKEQTTLLDALAELSPSSSKTALRSWIKEGRVTVDDIVVKNTSTIIVPGQKIAIGAKPKFADGKLRILYEDHHLVVIEKPAGLLSVAAAFQKEETVHALLKLHYQKHPVYVVHRLDQDTSGVMLFALSRKGYEGLKVLFEKHEIKRSYCAIIEGKLPSSSGTWQSYLYEDGTYTVHSSLDPEKGALAITHFEVRNTSRNFSRLDLFLETGRKNQIRVHCTDNGHPVVGDKKYGASTDPIQRLCLHAQSLVFIHPVTGKEMRFDSPVPKAFDRLVKKRD